MHLSGNGICDITSEDDINNYILDDVGQQMLLQPPLDGGSSNLISTTQATTTSTAAPIPPPPPPSSISSTATPMKTFAKLKKLVWLDLSGNRINHISANYLPKALVTLDLSRNILPAVPTHAIQHLHDLKILLLKDNLISQLFDVELGGGAVGGGGNNAHTNSATITNNPNRLRMEKFDLSINNIDTIPDRLFNGTAHVKAINFDKNYLTHLPANAFHNLATAHLVLAFNRLQSIDAAAFHTLDHTLEYLDLERNQLGANITAALLPLKRLRYLYLTANQITAVNYLPPTLRVLSLAGNNFTQIPLASLQACSDLSYLNIGYNHIDEIVENGFYDWGNQLQTLLLRNNKITRLNYGAFNGLDSIKEISLSFNDIHYVHANVFENISRTLKILELSFGIYREDFPMEQLKCLTELIWLGLDNNNLKVISDESLTTMRELTYINLSFNRIALLPRNIFMGEIHRNLMDIDLSYNMISTIFPYSFDSLSNLQFVTLAYNRIHTLDKHSFNNLPYLMQLDLTYNNLRNISENVFTFLPSLQRLDLMANGMEAMTFKMFKHVSNETMPLRLNISHNRLQHLDGEISSFLYINLIDASHNHLADTQSFRHLGYALRTLLLQHNNITQLVNHAFGDLEYLEILNLSHNRIGALRRRSFQGLQCLQELDLSNNQLDQLQVEQFSNLKKLRILSLAHNRLRTLPREVFLNTRLEYLSVEHNQLSVWPVAAFSDIGFTLRSVQFAANNLEYLDAAMFANTQFVFDLNVSRNKLIVLPDNTFGYLANLTNLDVSFNPIVPTNLNEILLHTPRVRRLNLSAMGLYSMPSLIARSVPHLTELDVSMNYLQEISSLRELHLLRVLRVAANKIANLTTFGERLPLALRVLDISHNPVRRMGAHDFQQIRYLEHLYMADVKVSNSLFLSRLRHLRVLRLNAQPLFGECVARLPSLQHLYTDMGGATRLDDTYLAALAKNVKLTTVEISGHRLRTITAGALEGLAKSQRLHLRITGTQITDFPAGVFYALRHVAHLSIDLSQNRVGSLAPDSFYPNASAWDAVGTRSVIGGLDMWGNPLQCDCGLVWLGHWLRRWLRETAQMNAISKEDARNMLLVSKRARAICLTSCVVFSFSHFVELFSSPHTHTHILQFII